MRPPRPTPSTASALTAGALALVAAVATAQVPNQYRTAPEDLPCVGQTLALRVHVVDDLDGEPLDFDTLGFEGAVRLTNGFFAPICLDFEVCEYLRVPNYRYASFEQEDGRNDGQEAAALFGDSNRIDIYIADTTLEENCGLATLGGARAALQRRAFIMVVDGCADSTSQTLAHELGHYFGLLHTFEGSDGGDPELVNGENCATAGDLLCDTPADPYVEGSNIQYVDPDDPCRFRWRGRDANGDYYVPHTANVMSYYSSACACGFTHDQLALMAGVFLGNREGLY